VYIEGVAKGGIVTLVLDDYEVRDRVSVPTAPGDMPEVVAKRLWEEIQRKGENFLQGPWRLPWSAPKAFFSDGRLSLGSGSRYYLVGTDAGPLPPLPTSMSVRYERSSDSIYCDFVPPPQWGERAWLEVTMYRSTIDINCGEIPHALLREVVSKNVEPRHPLSDEPPKPVDAKNLHGHAYTYYRHYRYTDTGDRYDRDFRSRPIYFKLSDTGQEELDNLPFYMNALPNWLPWNAEGSSVALEEGDRRSELTREEQALNLAPSPDKRCYYQVFKTDAAHPGPGGICRRFLGLLGGHKYRLSSRMNTFATAPKKGSWSFSLHACCEAPGTDGVTVDQMTAKAPLPDGSTGPEAGQVACFNHDGEGTAGKWVAVSTGSDNPGKKIGDLTLPDNCTAISVWFRVGADCETQFGTDYMALEDVTPPTFTLTDG
jgi:hypothetical protein